MYSNRMAEDINQIEFQNEKTFIGFEVIPLNKFFQNPKEILCHPHKDNFYNILFIEEGKGVLSIDFKDYIFDAGTIFTISPNQVQQHHLPLEANGFLIVFTQDFIVKYFDSKEVFRRLQIFDDAFQNPIIDLESENFEDILMVINRMIYEQNDEQKDQYTQGILRSVLHLLLLKLERFKQKSNEFNTQNSYFKEFLAFKNRVEREVKQHRNVMEYADQLHISSKKLNYICKQVAHKSAKEVIDDLAILYIKRDLMETQSTKQTAYNFAFDEPTNFIKYFKKNIGKTPYEFIKEQNN